jgi:hypothetical protein
MKKILLLTATVFLFLSACYYDNVEDLYPAGSQSCDTTNVTYSQTIAPIAAQYCNSCHSGTTPPAGIKTDTYTDLNAIAVNGKLWGVVNHDQGYIPMPYQSAKLSECNLLKIRKWIDAGSPDN